MMKLARLVLMLFLVAGWAAAQCGAQTTAAGDKGKKDAAAKDAMKADTKDASKAGEKDAAKSEAKSDGGMMAGGMGCCAKMGKDKDKDAAGGGMSCGGGKKDEDAESGTLPEQKMK